MTNVVVVKRNNSIISVECDGHTGYGVEGEDVVCAALSSIVQTALLGLLQVVGVKVDFKVDDKKGYLKMSVPEDMDLRTRRECDIVLDTMLLGVAHLNQRFSDFVNLEVK